MTKKKLFLRMLLIMGLVVMSTASMPGAPAYADEKVSESNVKNPDGSISYTTVYSSGKTTIEVGGAPGVPAGQTTFKTIDKDGNVTTDSPGGSSITRDKNGNLVNYTNRVTDAAGFGTTTTRDAKGNVISAQTTATDGKNIFTTTRDGTGKVIADSQFIPGPNGVTNKTIDYRTGNVTVQTTDKGSPLTTTTITDKSGKVVSVQEQTHDSKGGILADVTKDGNGNITSKRYQGGLLAESDTTNKNGQILSKTTYTKDAQGTIRADTYDAKGKLTSESVYDKNGKLVSQTGKQTLAAVGPGGPGSGVNPTSQGSGNHKKHNFLTDVFHKEKTQNQNWSSAQALSGSMQNQNQNQHHGKR
jgi:YD repeat-containing protein